MVYGWDDSQRKGLPLYRLSSPRVGTRGCGRASHFSRHNVQDGVSEHSSHFACTQRNSAIKWICSANPFAAVLTGDKVSRCSVLYRRTATPCLEPPHPVLNPPTLPYDKTKWSKSSLCHFFLRALQAGFGCVTILNTLEEAYPLPSIVLHHCTNTLR